ncbi:MAG: hypothetical protein QG657_1916 [Acidobacteriota bacterium]|nr:hypothetical protein [Acidobacteriota bacterium]
MFRLSHGNRAESDDRFRLEVFAFYSSQRPGAVMHPLSFQCQEARRVGNLEARVYGLPSWGTCRRQTAGMQKLSRYAVRGLFQPGGFFYVKGPESHIGGVACVDCHKDEKNRLLRPGKTVCSKCHEKDYEAMFDEWQTSGQEFLKQLREKVTGEN